MMKTETKKRIKNSLIAGTGASLLTMPFAFAADDDETMGKVVNKMVGLIATILRYVGILLLAWGVGMLVLSFKQEEAESKSKSILLIGVSAALIGIKSFIKTILSDFITIT